MPIEWASDSWHRRFVCVLNRLEIWQTQTAWFVDYCGVNIFFAHKNLILPQNVANFNKYKNLSDHLFDLNYKAKFFESNLTKYYNDVNFNFLVKSPFYVLKMFWTNYSRNIYLFLKVKNIIFSCSGSDKKSVEGSLALIISQFVIFIVIMEQGFIDPFNINNYLLISIYLFVTFFIEAYTNDNDNLTLPVVAYPFLILLKA